MKYQDYLLMSKEIKNMMVPKFRFPDFFSSEEWGEKKLGDVSDVRDGTHDSPKFVNEGKPLLTSKNLLSTGYLDFQNVSLISETDYERINKRSKVDIGDILFGMIGTIGNPVLVKSEGFAIKNVALIKEKKELLNNFLIHFLSSDYINSKFNLLMKGNAQKFIALGVIRNIIIHLPNLDEQQKIASCLSSLDDLITAENQKLDVLKAHKKGLMQQLFPAEGETTPKLRFEEFKDSGDWGEDELDNVAIFLKGKGISKSDISANGNQPCIRYGELYTHYKEVISSVISSTDLSADNLILSEEHDVIIPSSGETREDIATASCVIQGGIALGGDLNIIRSEINGVFLSYYLTHAKKNAIAKLAQGDAVVHLYSSQLKKLKINFPKEKKEQEKIGNSLSSLDVLITILTAKIESLKLHKKGLMQQLFPQF